MAQRWGRSTKVPSLVLACEKANPSVHKNYSMLYSSHISWSSPTTPTPLELYPHWRLTGCSRMRRDGDRSVLTPFWRWGDFAAPRQHLSDQRKLDDIWTSGARGGAAHRERGEEGELQGWASRRWRRRTGCVRRTASRRTSGSTCG